MVRRATAARVAAAAILAAACVRAAVTTVTVRVRADSDAPNYEPYRAMDGDPNTMWHTKWGPGEPPQPHVFTVDLEKPYPIEGFVYLPRKGRSNGTIKEYELFVGDVPELIGQPFRKGSFDPSKDSHEVRFVEPVTGRYVTIRTLSEVGGRPWASIAELRLLSPGVRFRGKREIDTTRVAGRALKPGEVYPCDDGTVEALLDLARRTLAYVELSRTCPDLSAELRALEAQTAAGPEDEEALVEALRQLRRRTILSHPALGFERLLINKRPPPAFKHQSDQYLGRYSGIGDGLVVLDSWKKDPRETVLLEGKLPPGSVLHPELSFDGSKVLFSYCDHTEKDRARRRFFIYEIGVDSNGLRQVTGTPSDPLAGQHGRRTVLIEDWDPCYLPDGGIAFVSTRNQGGVRCHHGGRYCPTYTLYRMDDDGSGIRPLSYGEANEWDPSVLHDGRIIWTRWDYINRHDTVYQGAWSIRPDGTGTAHFFGSYTRNPCVVAEARAVPGSGKVVATASAHHHYTAGSIMIIDPHQGQDADDPVTRLTPESQFPETEGWSLDGGGYASPWPINEDLYLVAYSKDYRNAKPNDYAVYLVDTLGGRELIYRDPGMSCFTPIPIRPRTRPPAMTSALDPATTSKTGAFHVQNVYASDQPIPKGSVKQLRIVRIYEQPAQRVPDRSLVLFELPKEIIGTVPVAGDGSVAFEAPAGVPLLFQLLDENGMCVMSMRTFVFLHPGERQTCVGCHEPRRATPANYGIAFDTPVRKPTPPVGPRYKGGLSFAKTVQPVLDRYCIRCHGLSEKPPAGVDLLGVMDPGPVKLGQVRASRAYHSLTRRKGLVSMALRNQEAVRSTPKDYLSHAGRLAGMLLRQEKDHPKLDRGSSQRIVDWLDLNGQFHGTYSWNKDGWREVDAKAESALRAAVAETLGEAVAAQPLAALVNIALPTESRALRAPLAVESGGWGQLDGGWASMDDPGYVKMKRLVEACIVPSPHRDVEGTCARPKCECRSCWVRQAEGAYRKAVASR